MGLTEANHLKSASINEREFLDLLIKRGLGLYGKEKIDQILKQSKIELLTDGSVNWLNGNPSDSLQTLMRNYAALNVPAKMTAVVLAKRFDIPVPDDGFIINFIFILNQFFLIFSKLLSIIFLYSLNSALILTSSHPRISPI